MRLRTTVRGKRILDFDIENRPLSYYGGDLTTADVTAIAWSWAGEEKVTCYQLQGFDDDFKYRPKMLAAFVVAYDEADIVTGHYIRKHDLPIINGALVELGWPTLSPKMTIDTKLDLVKWSYEAQPKSQQELALTLGIDAPKVQMSQQDWREANRLSAPGLAKTRERVVGDVQQHKAMRLELTRRGLLKGPKLWTP